MFCMKCGKKIPDNSNFCEQCGTRVVRNVTGTPQAPAASPMRAVPQTPAASPVRVVPPAPAQQTQPVYPSPAQPRTSSTAPAKPAPNNTTKILLIVGGCIAAGFLLLIIVIAVVFVGAKIIGSADEHDNAYTQDYDNYDTDNDGENYIYPDIGLYDYDEDDFYVPEDKRTLCVSCHGSGTCPVCDGTGVYSNYGQSSECSACDGTGVCSICDGSGYN